MLSLEEYIARRKQEERINEFNKESRMERYNHQYIFLEETPENAFGDVLINKIPMITDLLSK